MYSLLDQIAAEFKLRNPNDSAEEISQKILLMLSEDILPNVLRNITLPTFPSYRSVEFSKSRRIKEGKRKKHPQANMRYRRSLIQQVEQVRNEMGWDGADDFYPKIVAADSTSIQDEPRTDLPSLKNGRRKELDFVEKIDDSEKENANSTFQKLPAKPEKDIISLSETAQRKIVSEKLFEAVFKGIELKLRDTIIKRKLKTEIDVSCKSDIDIPSWNKCILKIHPQSNLSFTERMNISTIFDLAVRDSIKDLKKTADSDSMEYLKNLNRNLFVHIDL